MRTGFSRANPPSSRYLRRNLRARAYAVLFGDRGVETSSLANTVSSRIPTEVTNIKALKDNCRPEDTFFGLLLTMLWTCQYEGTNNSDYLKEETREFVATIMRESLSKDMQYVFNFDEIDRIADKTVKSAMADTIKHISDYP
jgi:hypothetical protein